MAITIDNININLEIYTKNINELKTANLNKSQVLVYLDISRKKVSAKTFKAASASIKEVLTKMQPLYIELFNLNNADSLSDYNTLLDIEKNLIEIKYFLDTYVPIETSGSFPDIERTNIVKLKIEEFTNKLKKITGYTVAEYQTNIDNIDFYDNNITYIDNKIRITTDQNILATLLTEKNNWLSTKPAPLANNSFTNKLSTTYNYNIVNTNYQTGRIYNDYKFRSYENENIIKKTQSQIGSTITKVNKGINGVKNIINGVQNTICAGVNLVNAVAKTAGAVINTVKGIVGAAGKILDAGKNILKDPLGALKKAGKGISKKFKKGIRKFKQVLSDPKSAFLGILDGVGKVLGGVPGAIGSCGMRQANCANSHGGAGIGHLGKGFNGDNPCGHNINTLLKGVIQTFGQGSKIGHSAEKLLNNNTIKMADDTLDIMTGHTRILPNITNNFSNDFRNNSINNASRWSNNPSGFVDGIRNSNNYYPNTNYKPWKNPDLQEPIFQPRPSYVPWKNPDAPGNILDLSKKFKDYL